MAVKLQPNNPKNPDFFNHGLSSVSDTKFEGGLPAPTSLTPVDQPLPSALEALQKKPSYDTFLESGIRPNVQNPGILTAPHFHACLQSSANTLSQFPQDMERQLLIAHLTTELQVNLSDLEALRQGLLAG